MSQYDIPIFWEYEDELPKVRPSQYELMFPLSRIIWGVRMYPYIKDGEGNKIYLGQVTVK